MAWKTPYKAHAFGAACVSLASLAVSANASAQGFTASLALPTAASIVVKTACGSSDVAGASLGAAPAEVQSAAATVSKSAAITGGVSKLEQMRLAQMALVAEPVAAAASAEAQIIEAAPALAAIQLSGCASFGSGDALERSITPTQMRTGDILDSRRVKIGKTMFDDDWNRVRDSKISRRAAKRFVGQRSSDKLAMLAQVNSAVNHKIAFVEDRDLLGVADQWASARSTLRKRKGDCEDIAIAKMQLLASLGFDPSKMTLTIAKDLARGRDHSILFVEHNGRSYMLDNETDELLDGYEAHDYRPIMSYSGMEKWIHGYSQGQT
ncbi:transglutaminase-like cysteine peptidase [Altererythrobacter sp. ZODW24]|uniref:transglutaminase-like cysteine peptidase n=1 Tax=Altererythrobacter sp. ZODW24 TaxID=2185142 RepID=UPI000DF85AB1|nr:transglutaminase-like cysteine peptidase [Altererythrobacter sp. ZODW24]